jgi:steroid 5-alpha reductase family enzyme
VTLLTLLATNLAIVLACMLGLWLLSLPLRNVSIVDIFWGPGFGIVAIATLLLVDGYEPRQWLLTVITVVWALRLGIYLAIRNIGHGEDPRYAKWRERVEREGGSFAVRSLFMVFGLQGLLMWFVSLPVQVGQAADESGPLGLLAWLGVALWLTGFLVEAVGDWQLSRFKADPANKGQVLDSGLWRYTRHPNYFGNACLWWGIWLVAADAGVWWTVLSPIVMTFLLLKVSGVALLEKSMQETKPKYQDYVERTSAFFPLPPKKPSSDREDRA